MAQTIFDDDVGFKVKEKVIKVVPKKVKNIKDITMGELQKLCFHNHNNVCYWLASDLQSCLGICMLWTSLKEKIVVEFKKRGNKHYIDFYDVRNKIECLKGFRVGEYNPFTKNTIQSGFGQYED